MISLLNVIIPISQVRPNTGSRTQNVFAIDLKKTILAEVLMVQSLIPDAFIFVTSVPFLQYAVV
jgi:hypothetical protein